MANMDAYHLLIHKLIKCQVDGEDRQIKSFRNSLHFLYMIRKRSVFSQYLTQLKRPIFLFICDSVWCGCVSVMLPWWIGPFFIISETACGRLFIIRIYGDVLHSNRYLFNEYSDSPKCSMFTMKFDKTAHEGTELPVSRCLCFPPIDAT